MSKKRKRPGRLPPEIVSMTVREWTQHEMERFESDFFASETMTITQWLVFRGLNGIRELAEFVDESPLETLAKFQGIISKHV